MFKAQLALGNVQEAKEALNQAIEFDVNDASNKKDSELMDTVLH